LSKAVNCGTVKNFGFVLLADFGHVEAFGLQQGVVGQQSKFARHIEGVAEIAQQIISGLRGPVAIGQPGFYFAATDLVAGTLAEFFVQAPQSH
jgi:hypothetical protein